MTIKDFSGLKKKELNTSYSIEVDGVTKLVELTDSQREEKKEGSKNCKTLYLAKVDGVNYEDYYNITDLCNKIAGKNVSSRKSNGTRKTKQSRKPLTDEELTDKINKHIDALQNAYTNFFNLLVSWGINTSAIDFFTFKGEDYRNEITYECEQENNELKETAELERQLAEIQAKLAAKRNK